MYYLNDLGFGVKKFNSEDEARSNLKNGKDVMVAFTYDEYKLLLDKHREEIDCLNSKLDYYKELASDGADIASLLIEKDNEIGRLSKSLEGHKKAVMKWKDKMSGEKGITKSKGGTNLTYIQLNFNVKKDVLVKIIIETSIPINMKISEVKEFFENTKIQDIFPELENAEEYVISEVYCGKKKDIWSVVLVKY